jgi:hypothetical protein
VPSGPGGRLGDRRVAARGEHHHRVERVRDQLAPVGEGGLDAVAFGARPSAFTVQVADRRDFEPVG